MYSPIQKERYHATHDIRGWFNEPNEEIVKGWRIALRTMLFDVRKGLSDLTFRPLGNTGFEMHEGLFSRAHVPASVKWQHLLFSGPNCFLLSPEEHRPQPPDRVECYWLSVARYGKAHVDAWVDSLPFKATPDLPWRGTNHNVVCNLILSKYPVSPRGHQYITEAMIRLTNTGD